jgi:glycosyltransferase involved in cell wall biosynthesis
MTATVYINGKFTAQRLTGVQRYAGELVRALDLAVEAGERWVLLVPPQGTPPALRHIEVKVVAAVGPSLHLWEQLALPLAARSGLLLNLAGSAPLLARRQWCTFHDAAVFDHPDVFTPAFRRWYRFHFRWLARHAERLLTVSAHSRRRLALHLGLPEAAIGIVPNGGDHLIGIAEDPAVLQRLGLQGCRWFVAVGSESRLKNWPVLLRAWSLLAPPPDLRLVLVGGRNAAVFAGQQPVATGARQMVHAGAATDGELKALLQGAVALVMPSLDEGFGLPPLEAMALGCAAVVADAGALPEVCGDAALYVDPRDPAHIAVALQRCLAEPALREGLAAAGPAHAAALTWRQSAVALRALLAQAAGDA